MKLLFTEHLAELNALNSDKLFVEATGWKITMRLKAVVAITNYKALAAAGRAGDGASFDARTRTLTVYLKQKSECEQHGGGFFVDYFRFLRVDSDTWERAVAVYQYDNFDALLQLAKRLAKKGAKTFSSTQEATAGRGARGAGRGRERQLTVTTIRVGRRNTWTFRCGKRMQTEKGTGATRNADQLNQPMCRQRRWRRGEGK